MVVFLGLLAVAHLVEHFPHLIVRQKLQILEVVKPSVLQGFLQEADRMVVQINSAGADRLLNQSLDEEFVLPDGKRASSHFVEVVERLLELVALQVELPKDLEGDTEDVDEVEVYSVVQQFDQN